jgi:hypothetical protein
MREGKPPKPVTFKLIGGPGTGTTFEAFEPVKQIIRYEDNSVYPSRYCVYMRKMGTTEYHHITGCCNRQLKGSKQ